MLGIRKTASVSGGTTLISHETKVVGDVHFSGNLDVEGLVQGNIIAQAGSDALLRVLGKGRVEGEIRVPCVIITGAVEGNVYSSQRLELAAKSHIQGSVFYNLVEMAAGSEVNGSLTHVPEVDAAVADVSDSFAKPQGEAQRMDGVESDAND
jgi:cytoskeletal protein CcmA (bactofilin family)